MARGESRTPADVIAGDATLQTLYEIALAASSARDVHEVARLAVERARTLIGADGAVVFEHHAHSGLLHPLHETESAESEGPARPGEGAVGKAFVSRRPVIVDDYSQWPDAMAGSRRRGMVGAVAVPLLVSDRAIGAMGAWRYHDRPFTERDTRLLSLVAAHLAAALQAARRAAEAEASVRIFQALHEVAVASSGVLEPRLLAELTSERIAELLQVEGAGIWWWEEAEGRLRHVASRDSGARVSQEPYSEADGAVGRAFASAMPIVVDDYPGWRGALPRWLEAGLQSTAAVPLVAGDAAVGVLSTWSYHRRHFSPEDVRLMNLFASQVAPAVLTARLVGEREQQTAVLAALNELARAATTLVEPAVLARQAVDLARQTLGVRSAAVAWRGDRPDQELVRLADNDARLAPPVVVPSGQGLLRRAFESGRPQVTDDYAELPDAHPDVLAAGICSVAAVPLMVGDTPVGSLVARSDEYAYFRPDRLELMRLLAEQIAPALQASWLHADLGRSEERFRAVFEHAGIGIVRIGLDRRIVEVNPAARAMLGYSEGEVEGLRADRLVHPDDWQPERYMKVVDGSTSTDSAEMRLLRRDGGVLWSNTTLTSVPDPGGTPAFMIAMIEDATARKAQEAALAHQALHDALTELPNRTLLHDRVHQAIREARRDGSGLALLIMDLDHFKEVNDTFGHHAGDLLLREVAARFRAELRDSDTVARLGGDEFAVVLSHAAGSDAAIPAARKLLRSLESPFLIEGEQVQAGASVGIALYPEHGADADLLMRHADVAMYVAKRSGSGYAVYAAESDEHTPGRLALVADLRHALDRGELELHYQPKIDIALGRVTGVEALVRWRHPTRGMLAPDQFIGVAEHTGLIRPLGLWVLDAAIEQCARWSSAGHDLKVAVNLSVRNLHDPVLAQSVEDLLNLYGVRPERLQLEITESTLMVDPEYARRVLERLDALGVELSIDDFGTGYSSLSYLRRLPVKEIKIDRSFVIDMAHEENAAVIVRSTVDLGHNLGLKVVAEGVEDEAAWQLVRAGGVDLAQGNLLGRAVPAAEVADLLLEVHANRAR